MLRIVEQPPLTSIREVSRKRAAAHKRVAGLRKTYPLGRLVNGASGKEPAPIVSIDSLAEFDTIYNAAVSLTKKHHSSASAIARALLDSLLRLSWARVTKRPDCNPEPSSVPLKLFNRKSIDKPALERLRASLSVKAKTDTVLGSCRELLIWLADLPGSPLG